MADDRQRIGVLQTLHESGRGAEGDRAPRLLDHGHPQHRGLGLMRRTAAVWAGKATGALSRISRLGGGTTLPGDVARAIDPDVLRKLSHDLKQGAVVISGTNGKTTTARLISWLLEGAGYSVVSNRAGANLIFGATAAALEKADANGKLNVDWGVFEIDEASLGRAVDEIQPRAAIVLNLFRDQLDRYGELETIAKRIEAALARLPDSSRAILNADDPRVAEIGLASPDPCQTSSRHISTSMGSKAWRWASAACASSCRWAACTTATTRWRLSPPAKRSAWIRHSSPTACAPFAPPSAGRSASKPRVARSILSSPRTRPDSTRPCGPRSTSPAAKTS